MDVNLEDFDPLQTIFYMAYWKGSGNSRINFNQPVLDIIDTEQSHIFKFRDLAYLTKKS
jgi:hypothetical protein